MDQSARVRRLGFVEAYSESLFGLFLFVCFETGVFFVALEPALKLVL